ncbi:MAG TPA: multidrug efflux RND transporter permease subunit [Burkholderiales bacterium]|nr:multidrug efflux RND transporter permease subunit [Burkholderiales bacterium]
MAHFFIARPVFAIVAALFIVLVGAIAGFQLPIAQYPQITLPTVVVAAAYPGASAQTVEQSVAQPIEQQVNGVEGMLYMQSTSTGAGTYSLRVTFGLGTNADIASVQVQNRVAQANSLLPSEVIAGGVTTRKSTPDTLMFVTLFSPKGTYDSVFLANYLSINIVDAIRRVKGVGDVQVFGAEFGMRIWLKPDRMSQLGITAADVANAVREQNVQAPAGQVGQYPSPPDQAYQYSIEVRGRLVTEQEFGNIVVKAQPDGSFVRVRDIARVELGAQNYSVQARYNDRPSAAFGVNLTPEASAVDVAAAVRARLKELERTFPPDLTYSVVVDSTVFVKASLEEVLKTLVEAMLLVMAVVFLFLQTWRATLIPLLAIPVSLIGTLAVFITLGFSLNTLTLFGMVLAIGIVVDDAIVVVEAVEHHIAQGMSPRDATTRAMDEVSGPVIAIALVLAAVFVPVSFMGGIAGALYRQFALTVAVSTLISAFVALSLTPALSALLLKPRSEGGKRGLGARFFGAFNRGFERVTDRYGRLVAVSIRRMALTLALLAAFALGTVVLFGKVPAAFVPPEDQGFVIGAAVLPEASSLNRTMEATARLDALLAKVPGVQDRLIVNGFNILASSQQPNGALFVTALEPWDQRATPEKSVDGIIGRIFARSAAIPQATVVPLNPPALPGLGAFGGFSLMLQDRQGRSPFDLVAVADQFIAAASKRPEVGSVRSALDPRTPAYDLQVDREKAKKLGVPLTDVFATLQTYLGSLQVNDFNRFGRSYKVTLQADAPFRNNVEDIKLFYVRSARGDMVPLSTLVKAVSTSSPAVLQRYNQFRTAAITGDAAPGYSSSQANAALAEVAAQVLPAGYAFEWSGLSLQEQETAGQTSIIFALTIVCVFLFLAALYESWSVPFAVLLAVPIGIFGAMLALAVAGLTNNIYAQIGLILLIGLSAKNAILIVEFAKVAVDRGDDPVEAAVEAAKLRLRPILMTSFAFILGVVPLASATGAGAGARVSMGVAVVWGMTCATLVGIFIIPVLFVAVERAVSWTHRRRGREMQPAPEEEAT